MAELYELWSDVLRLSQEDAHFDFEQASILDLGCNTSYGVLDLFASTGFARYRGIEKRSREDLNYFSLYNDYTWRRSEEFLDVPEFDEQSFNQRISVHYGVDVEDFLPTHQEKYDIIVISNLLHLNGPKQVWRSIMKNASNCLKPDGYLYIRVFVQPNDYGGYFNEAELGEMEQMLTNAKKTLVHKNDKVRLFGRVAM